MGLAVGATVGAVVGAAVAGAVVGAAVAGIAVGASVAGIAVGAATVGTSVGATVAVAAGEQATRATASNIERPLNAVQADIFTRLVIVSSFRRIALCVDGSRSQYVSDSGWILGVGSHLLRFGGCPLCRLALTVGKSEV
jgi:hypothetical protein